MFSWRENCLCSIPLRLNASADISENVVLPYFNVSVNSDAVYKIFISLESMIQLKTQERKHQPF